MTSSARRAIAIYFFQPVDLFIAESVAWGNVSRVVEALGRAGYGLLKLVFAVVGRASPPPESEALRRFVAIGTSQDEMPWQRLLHAAQTLEDRHPRCARITNPVRAQPSDSAIIEAQRKDFVARAAGLARECGCESVDLREVKAFAWTRFGRQWGPLTTTVSIENARADDERSRARAISLPAATPWREAYRHVLDAAKDDRARLSFVVAP